MTHASEKTTKRNEKQLENSNMNHEGLSIIYKYRNWSNTDHKNILLQNEIYLAPPSSFNDPFDCGITQSFKDLTEDEKEEYMINAGKQMFLRYNNYPGFNLEKQFKDLEARFKKLKNFQLDYDTYHYNMQNDHFGVFSGSTKWDSILMWSHYSDNHKFSVTMKISW